MSPIANVEERQLAIDRWNELDATIDPLHRAVIDRVALGENLKSVCFDLDLRYENVQKRMRRAQRKLGLTSTALFLHVWITVRGLDRDAVSPMMVRHAGDIANEIARQSVPSGHRRLTARA